MLRAIRTWRLKGSFKNFEKFWSVNIYKKISSVFNEIQSKIIDL